MTGEMPSFFIVIPIATLLAITAFRYGHFFDHQFGGHLPKALFATITAGVWAFELWYAVLGLLLLGVYFRKHLFDMKYFDESQWGLVCPVVAMAVLGTFVYKTLLPSPFVLAGIVLMLVLDVAIISVTAWRQYRALMGRACCEQEAPKAGVASTSAA